MSPRCVSQCVHPMACSGLDKCVRQNLPMAQTTAERQRAFKESMKEAGYVRLEAYVSREQRDKFRQLGGDEWLRERINRAKVKE